MTWLSIAPGYSNFIQNHITKQHIAPCILKDITEGQQVKIIHLIISRKAEAHQ